MYLTEEQLQKRLDELQSAVEEYQFLQDLLYLEAEGFIRIEDDMIYPKGHAWPFPDEIPPVHPGSGD